MVATLTTAPAGYRAVQGLAWVVVSDIRMPGIDGMELLRQLHEQDADPPVILITGHGDVPLAVQAIARRRYDSWKPFPSDALLDGVRRALEVRRLVLENRTLRLALAERHELHGRLIGRSAGMQRLREQVGSLAAIQADVLVLAKPAPAGEVVGAGPMTCRADATDRSSRSTAGARRIGGGKLNCSATRPAPSPARRSAASAVRVRQWRHPVPRRDREHEPGRAGQACALLQERVVERLGSKPADPAGYPHHRGNQGRPAPGRRPGPLPRRPLLPPQRRQLAHPTAAASAARTSRCCSAISPKPAPCAMA